MSHFFSLFFTLSHTLLGILAKAPSGTIEVPGMHNVYLDRNEVTNAQWKEYMAYVKAHPGEFEEGAYAKSYPNLELWTQAYPAEFERPNRFDAYPVVGISFPQIVHFCRWRSLDISTRRKQEIVYTLPTVLEYKRAARGSKPMAVGLYATDVDIPTFIGLCDNVHEMTELEGIAMMGYGGNCLDTLFFFKARADMGFRCKAYFK